MDQRDHFLEMLNRTIDEDNQFEIVCELFLVLQRLDVIPKFINVHSLLYLYQRIHNEDKPQFLDLMFKE